MNSDIRSISFASRIAASEAEHSQPEPVVHPSGMDSTRHLFVDNVRFWSMFAIVAIHSTVALWLFGNVSPRLMGAAVAPWKFGTIAFFLISGFLLGERLQRCNPIEYFGRRLQKLFLPWFFWIFLLVAALLASDIVHNRVQLPISINALPIVGQKFFFCLTSTAFWFVPNLLVALGILLLFRRHLYDLRFGAALLAINLFYVVNVYMLWIPSCHTTAVFAFVFHLWLGSYASHHYKSLTQWISRISMGALAGLALLAGLIGFGEALILAHLKSPDPNNTLRLSNQIFSIAVVLLILKFRRATWPRFVDVRSHTFGIYLSHSIILDAIMSIIQRSHTVVVARTFLDNAAGRLSLWLIVTVLTYSVCLAIVKVVAGWPRFQWMIGVGSQRGQPNGLSHQVPAYEIPLRKVTEISFS